MAPRTRKLVIDPKQLDRIRTAREAEDSALVAVALAAADRARAEAKRTEVVASLDAAVVEAEAALTAAHAEFVTAAGPERAAVVLGLPVGEARKLVAKPAKPASRPTHSAIPSVSFGGQS